MSAVLLPHPSTPAKSVERLSAQVSFGSDRRLHLRFRLTGAIDSILWPEPAPGQRNDGLWRHTCFEAFLQSPGGGYREYNRSPSGARASYEFSGYRTGMKPLLRGADPVTSCQRGPRSFELSATLDLQGLEDPLAALRLGLSAVIEDRARLLSYFALKHPAEKPDFHHADSFIAVSASMKEPA
jgi:hypothetical protein